MFTGIVSAAARVVVADANRLGIDHAWIAKRLKIGGSVAVNGCCLTVVKKRGPVFFADVVPETLRRTNLGGLRIGSGVNLELPLSATSLLDGHLVQGHVDATGAVRTVEQATSGRELTIELPAAISRFVAVKGSIAVDGVSLTVASGRQACWDVQDRPDPAHPRNDDRARLQARFDRQPRSRRRRPVRGPKPPPVTFLSK